MRVNRHINRDLGDYTQPWASIATRVLIGSSDSSESSAGGSTFSSSNTHGTHAHTAAFPVSTFTYTSLRDITPETSRTKPDRVLHAPKTGAARPRPDFAAPIKKRQRETNHASIGLIRQRPSHRTPKTNGSVRTLIRIYGSSSSCQTRSTTPHHLTIATTTTSAKKNGPGNSSKSKHSVRREKLALTATDHVLQRRRHPADNGQ